MRSRDDFTICSLFPAIALIQSRSIYETCKPVHDKKRVVDWFHGTFGGWVIPALAFID